MRGGMAQWRVQDGSDVRELSDEKLRKLLRGGDLSGAELARKDGELEWRPLHSFDVFREEVPFQGGSAAAARRRLLVGLGWHIAAFTFVGAITGWPVWMAFWGIGLAFHVIGVVRKLGTLRLRTSNRENAPAIAKEAVDPLQAEIEAAFAALEKAAAGRSDIDVAGTRRAAVSLAQRRAALLPLCAPSTRERLDDEPRSDSRVDVGPRPSESAQ